MSTHFLDHRFGVAPEQRQRLVLDPGLPGRRLLEEHLGGLPQVPADMHKVQDEREVGKPRLDALLQGWVPITEGHPRGDGGTLPRLNVALEPV